MKSEPPRYWRDKISMPMRALIIAMSAIILAMIYGFSLGKGQ